MRWFDAWLISQGQVQWNSRASEDSSDHQSFQLQRKSSLSLETSSTDLRKIKLFRWRNWNSTGQTRFRNCEGSQHERMALSRHCEWWRTYPWSCQRPHESRGPGLLEESHTHRSPPWRHLRRSRQDRRHWVRRGLHSQQPDLLHLVRQASQDRRAGDHVREQTWREGLLLPTRLLGHDLRRRPGVRSHPMDGVSQDDCLDSLATACPAKVQV